MGGFEDLLDLGGSVPERVWPAVRCPDDLQRHEFSVPVPLGGSAVGHLLVGRLPPELVPDPVAFEAIWNLHPEAFPRIQKWDREIPRWQQSYGPWDYYFSDQTNVSLPMPPTLEPFLAWAQKAISPFLNGTLLNWYDAEKKHYIGRHRDSKVGLVANAPIVTISLGATRAFRMRPWKIKESSYHDVEVRHGDVVVIPWDTNSAWTHEVPHLERYEGRRVSVTLRAFFDRG